MTERIVGGKIVRYARCSPRDHASTTRWTQPVMTTATIYVARVIVTGLVKCIWSMTTRARHWNTRWMVKQIRFSTLTGVAAGHVKQSSSRKTGVTTKWMQPVMPRAALG
jgi:Fe2+ transport system protein B